MKIQSCTARLLKYPALATLAAMASTAVASNKTAQQPAAPAENQSSSAHSPKQPPHPYSGVIATDSKEYPEEEVPQYFLGEREPDPTEATPQQQTPSTVPQNTAGSVPCPSA